MKRCPKCGTTYTDVTLSYCLADGTPLTGADEQPTVIHAAGQAGGEPAFGSPMRVDIPQQQESHAVPPPRPVQAESGPSTLKVVLIVGVVLAMLGIAAVVAGGLIYFNKDTRSAPNNTNTLPNNSANKAATSPTPMSSNSDFDNDAAELRKEIANLERKLNEQTNSSKPPANSTQDPNQPIATLSTARVAPTGDGFLAMRSLPSSEIGERVRQIPNGATVALGGCLPRTRVGNKTGRWCRATYGGNTGWVFDAWLIY